MYLLFKINYKIRIIFELNNSSIFYATFQGYTDGGIVANNPSGSTIDSSIDTTSWLLLPPAITSQGRISITAASGLFFCFIFYWMSVLVDAIIFNII